MFCCLKGFSNQKNLEVKRRKAKGAPNANDENSSTNSSIIASHYFQDSILNSSHIINLDESVVKPTINKKSFSNQLADKTKAIADNKSKVDKITNHLKQLGFIKDIVAGLTVAWVDIKNNKLYLNILTMRIMHDNETDDNPIFTILQKGNPYLISFNDLHEKLIAILE